jgi:hypothetical protein
VHAPGGTELTLSRPRSVGQVVAQKTVELVKKLEKYPGVKTLGAIPLTHSPVLSITFKKGSERFRISRSSRRLVRRNPSAHKNCGSSACFPRNQEENEEYGLAHRDL